MTSDLPVLIQGDARALPLPDESVDLVVTSPPFFALRDYGTDGQIGAEPTPQEFIAALLDATREMVRVLKPSGSIFVNLGDKYTGSGGHAPDAPSQVARRAGASSSFRGATTEHERQAGAGSRGARWGLPVKSLVLLPERYRIACVCERRTRAVIVWSKVNGLPESVTDRVRRSHEDWVHLTKSPRYFSAVDEIREPYEGDRAMSRRVKHPGEGRREQRAAWEPDQVNPLGRMPSSVWEIATQPLHVPAELGVDHYAAFPMEWPRRLITGWCPPGGTVLDPFSGTGTTALVATMLGRRGIGVDLSADYQRIARWRCADPRERARAAGREPDARAVKPGAGQFDLFEEIA